MNIHLYALNYNEMRTLPPFMAHYGAFVSQFFIFDDGSTDGSVEYLKQFPPVSAKAKTFDRTANKASIG